MLIVFSGPIIKEKRMLKSSRLSVVFASLVVLILLVQITALAGNTQSQEPSAGSKTSQKVKSSKKKKKKVASVPYLVLGSATQTVPVEVKSVTVTPVTESALEPRNVSTAMKTPGVHVSPAGAPAPTGALPLAGQIIISEFRVRGPSGAQDEFIELYNASGADHTVTASGGTGYGVAASDGVTRCTIPNGTVIPNRGHYLCVNSAAYSLASYPAGNGTTATGDATYTTDIPDNAGIAIFDNNLGGANYNLANRLDAVGSTSEADTLYKEGTGYPALTPFSIDYSFYRDTCGKQGSITTV